MNQLKTGRLSFKNYGNNILHSDPAFAFDRQVAFAFRSPGSHHICNIGFIIRQWTGKQGPFICQDNYVFSPFTISGWNRAVSDQSAGDFQRRKYAKSHPAVFPC
jgi:hypothetical protein